MGEIKKLNGHNLADEEMRTSFRALRRKVLAITGGLLNIKKIATTAENTATTAISDRRCVVTQVNDDSTEEAVFIKCGHFGTALKLRLDSGSRYTYRIANINNSQFDPESLYTDVTNTDAKTILEVNIDNEFYSDFSALKTVGLEFSKLFFTYESNGAYEIAGENETVETKSFVCRTTVCVTPGGMSVMETIFHRTINEDDSVTETAVSDTEGVAKIPSGFITNARVKVKAIYGKRMVFGLSGVNALPPYHNTYCETVENDGCSTLKKILFEEVG